MDTCLGCGYLFRRGSSKALEKYKAVENEVVVNTDLWTPQIWIAPHWTAPHWVVLHGDLLYGLSRVAFFCDGQRVVAFGAGVHIRPLVLDSVDLASYIPSAGELVINSDICIVHVGDGQKLGGHPVP